MARNREKTDPEFGAKLDHLAGILGHRYPSRKFVKTHLAAELEVDNTQFRRMCNGQRAVPKDFLARVVAAFGLQRHGITYEDFELALEAFKVRMRDQRVGLFGEMTIVNGGVKTSHSAAE